jgi:DNA-binding transcriptional MocR family regulator
MCYGPDPGDPRLLKNVAQWLTNFYQPADAIAESRVCITGGASQNLACLLQVFTDPAFTRNVWIVAPAYMLSFRIFEDAGFHKKLRAIPEDDEGIDIEYLRQQIKKSEEKARADGNNEPVSQIKLMHRQFSVFKRPALRCMIRAILPVPATLRRAFGYLSTFPGNGLNTNGLCCASR